MAKLANIVLCLCMIMAVSCQMMAVNRPIIGILTQPTSTDLAPFGTSYIAASYVKYLEMAGAQVVPIHYESSQQELKEMFGYINGVLFPGGGSDLHNTTLYQAGQYLYDLALDAFKKGDYFPVMGHCMGFELLVMITSQNFDILRPVDAENITLPLHFTDSAPASRMFGKTNSQILDILSTQNVTMNNHQWSLYGDTYENTSSLKNFYKALSLNKDRGNQVFVSSIEGYNAPVFGIQWHAEKPQFEWNNAEVINHSADAILAMQSMGNFFVGQARLSGHSFPNQQTLDQYLIYNSQLFYTEQYDPSFEECYCWNYTGPAQTKF